MISKRTINSRINSLIEKWGVPDLGHSGFDVEYLEDLMKHLVAELDQMIHYEVNSNVEYQDRLEDTTLLSEIDSPIISDLRTDISILGDLIDKLEEIEELELS